MLWWICVRRVKYIWWEKFSFWLNKTISKNFNMAKFINSKLKLIVNERHLDRYYHSFLAFNKTKMFNAVLSYSLHVDFSFSPSASWATFNILVTELAFFCDQGVCFCLVSWWLLLKYINISFVCRMFVRSTKHMLVC